MRCACWMNKSKTTFLRGAFVVYAAIMLWLLFGQRYEGGFGWEDMSQLLDRVNLKPLHTIKSFLWVLMNDRSLTAMRHAFVNLAGNVVMFVPLGFFFAVLFRRLRNFGWMLLCTVVLICLVELVQLFTLLGSCDVDDLLLNVIGAIIGWCIGMLIRKK